MFWQAGVTGKSIVQLLPRITSYNVCYTKLLRCHMNEYNDWKGSHHDHAMDYASDSTVLGDFSYQTLQTQGHTYKMFRKEGSYNFV